MKLDDDFDEYGNGKLSAAALAISIAVISLVVVCVLLLNRNPAAKPVLPATLDTSDEEIIEETDPLKDPYSDIAVTDLEFFDMYKESDDAEVVDAGLSEERKKEEASSAEETDITKDGKHTKIVYKDGTEEWVSISPYLLKNDYDITNLIDQNGKYRYFEDGREISYLGVDISKSNDYVDYVKLSKTGVDFCMIKVGQRGYQTGDITEDDYYRDNLKRAYDAGLDVGVYFTSYATTEEEAVEEANWLVEKLGGFVISYPVVFTMDSVINDTTRTDDLSKNDRTMIARAFLSRIKECGYKPMILADKEWLLKKYDLAKLINDYDFWIKDADADFPDYPYKYSMWQYSETGSLDGIKGNCNMDISFVDYSLR